MDETIKEEIEHNVTSIACDYPQDMHVINYPDLIYNRCGIILTQVEVARVLTSLDLLSERKRFNIKGRGSIV